MRLCYYRQLLLSALIVAGQSIFGSLFGFSAEPLNGIAAERPNIILIMVDDMGFSDLGCYGGEIETPNIDQLAAGGLRFALFYNSGRCCPTRATLMTGLHPHQTGIGHMTLRAGKSPQGAPGPYQGYLNKQCVTLAEVLSDSGYATYMTGKWHLGMHDQSLWPMQRGFEKFYGALQGGTRYFFPLHPRGMTLGNQAIDDPESTTDEAFYTTDAFTDYAIRFIAEHDRPETPFFLYLAYTAPHWPLHAFEDDIAKYRGKYKSGWEQLRQQRYQRQIELGLIDSKWQLSKPSAKIPKWDSLTAEQQDEMDLKMSVYAAMIDRVDQNIGRLLADLKARGSLENTLIMFLTDNGACAEGGMLGRGNFVDIDKRNQETGNAYGEAWANASSTPFRLYKSFAHEGGAATPFIMHWPAAIQPQQAWYRELAQIIDIMPTLLDVADSNYPQQRDGQPIPPLDGISLRPTFAAQPLQRQDPICIEHQGNAFVRSGNWKLVGRGVAGRDGTASKRWELYDMKEDRTETKDLVASFPEKAAQLASHWEAWANEVGVYPKRGK